MILVTIVLKVNEDNNKGLPVKHSVLPNHYRQNTPCNKYWLAIIKYLCNEVRTNPLKSVLYMYFLLEKSTCFNLKIMKDVFFEYKYSFEYSNSYKKYIAKRIPRHFFFPFFF